ncbi:MAG: neutral/alkaline non-lysosomal ceramidase N-terminal domain-containing protein [Pirellulaceae bacterium]
MTDFCSRREFLGRAAASVTVAGAIGRCPEGLAQEPSGSDASRRFPWQAGTARAVLTPRTSVWLAGYGSKRPPDGKLHDLWMKALALQDPAGRRVVLVTSDFQGVPRSMSDQVFMQLREKFGLERHQVMFTFSHNHCGPRLGDDLVDYYPVEAEQVALVDEYTQEMIARTVVLVGESLGALAPARLQLGQGRTTFAVNRRNNREADVPELLAKGLPLAGPVDHTVPVLQVTRPDGKVAAVLFGYACHPTTLSFLTWCGDYPGFAQLEIEARYPGAQAMFVNTCGGDQNPLPRRSVELCHRYGHMLAVAVQEALTEPLRDVSAGIRSAFTYVDLPYLKVVDRGELHAAMQDANAIRARWAARMLQKLDAGESFPPSYPYPLHAWQLGTEWLVLGMGAETVVDYALRFKREFGPGTWVCGYADDMIAYIPSHRVWLEGGYEGGSNLYEYGRPAFRWSGEIEDRIATAMRGLVEQVRP